ncbi:glycosyltransferase [Algoriphagus yeomjeoni]|uniref:Alpha 1,4-glycosyltransferase n=1 Tax=Algoriphagus yeomjeoni TaxID=291403 RepID=A0A327P016_9BACT|nr:glycosyltransferase [Algoriphagus yeomjeoni]RAI85588.1 alpha 1,4-glycosyltransferase [Algoriphagus yeomjeoni]
MKTNIPQIIHHCWFGNNPIGEFERSCIDSWSKALPNILIKLWSQDSLNINQYPFAKQALENGKYAFVSDVIRLHVLYEHGGIYLDTDILILKDFSELLKQDFFVGEYSHGRLNAAVIGAKAKHPLIGKMLDYYRTLDFDVFKPLTIPEVFDMFVWDYPQEGIIIYPPEYFYPLPMEQKEDDYTQFLTNNSYCVHLWNHSWKDEFVLMKANQFLQSLSLAGRNIYRYPKTYRNRSYLLRYFKAFKAHSKRYLHQLIFPS